MNEKLTVPVHTAIIMDGNGRWAKKRGLKRTEGHRKGVETVKRIVKVSVDYGMEFLTLYAFSTENWRRSKEEINFLFHLFVTAINEYIPELKENKIRINFIGDAGPLPEFVKRSIQYAFNETANNNRMILNIALDYGGRREIIEAIKKVLSSRKRVKITEETFKDFLYTAGQPDPDLIIRTGGEKRLSNFLLYQSAYSELFFTDTLWPDFTEKEYLEILKDYSKRERRFGKAT